MIEYLGKIGNNQHTTNGFNKKSYPLQRDIIARTLGQMKEEISPVLMDVLKTNNNLELGQLLMQ